jgi:hypothetical protein
MALNVIITNIGLLSITAVALFFRIFWRRCGLGSESGLLFSAKLHPTVID